MNEISQSVVTLDDFQSVCRVCLKINGDMSDIFGIGIHNKIMQVTSIKMSLNDKLPHLICQNCKLQVENISEFVQQVKSSDSYLKSLLSHQPEEESSNEERKDPKRRSPRKRHKKWSRCLKTNKKPKSNSDTDKMYLILVPKPEDSPSKMDIEVQIKDLNLENDNLELTHYCRSLVNNHFSDHTYPKEQRNFEIVNKSVLDIENGQNKIFAVSLDIYKCCECSVAFEEVNDFREHLSNHEIQTAVLENFFTCPVCGYSEPDKTEFLNHLRRHRGEGFSFMKVNSSGEGVSLDEKEKEIFIDSVLNDTNDYKVFLLNLDTIFCTGCSKNIKSEHTIPSHLKTCSSSDGLDINFNIKYTCPVCCDVFIDQKENFIQHLDFHRKENFHFVKVDDTGQLIELDVDDQIYVPYNEAVMLMNVFNSEASPKIFKVVNVNSCEKCDFVADSFYHLSEHYKVAHSEEMTKDCSFSCPVCQEVFNSGLDENLYEHLRMHVHEGMNFMQVTRNNSLVEVKGEHSDIFTQSRVLWSIFDSLTISPQVYWPELIVYEVESPESKYTCDLCQEEFNKKRDVIEHLESHKVMESRESVSYICEKCGKKCSGKGNYRKHFSQHLKGFSSAGRRPSCGICNKTFANRATLNGHMRHHLREGTGNEFQTLLGIICEKCGKSFSNNASLTKHKKLHSKDKENAVLKCEICNRDFFRQSSFDRHKSAHLNPKYFECDLCKLPLSSVTSLQKHLESHRNGSNTFDCKACKLSFLSKDSLTAHQTHTGHYLDRKPLECNVCHEKFFIGRKFSEHIKTHPKYKMGECTLCGKRLSTIQSLMLHMGRHFESNSILCPHCGKQFFEERNYHRHLLTHEGIKPFPCDVENCKKSFYTLFELNRHKKYHNNTRDFRCPYCSKSFHEANHLTVHVRTHTGERPYTCPHCNKGFVTRTRCKHHIKLVHQGVGYDLIQSTISKKVTVFEAVEALV